MSACLKNRGKNTLNVYNSVSLILLMNLHNQVKKIVHYVKKKGLCMINNFVSVTFTLLSDTIHSSLNYNILMPGTHQKWVLRGNEYFKIEIFVL